jgi:cytochrome c biogenesis protein CcmG/thiol:disulfide interchange protein DsbE
MGTDIKSPGEIQVEKAVGARTGKSRRRSIITFTVVSLLNAGLLAILWIALLTPATGSNSTRASDPLIGKPAPDFTLAALNKQAGPAIHLANLKGKLVVINFWASWCDPCKEEAPLLQAAWRHAQGVIFIGVDFQDSQSDGLNFLQQHGITYANVVDPNGATGINYGVTDVPETFFIDRRGVIVNTVRNEITAQQLQNNVALLLHCISGNDKC